MKTCNVPKSVHQRRVAALILLGVAAWLLMRMFAPSWAQQMEPESVMRFLEDVVERHGCAAVFAGALVEGLLFVSWYAPGSTVVLVAAMLAGRGVIGLPAVVVSASAGFAIGYTASYCLGRYGWAGVAKYIGLEPALRRAQTRVNGASAGAFVLMFAHPHCGVLAATAAGVLHQPPGRVLPLMAASATFWSAAWGIAAFALGRWVLNIINGPAFAIVAIGVLLFLVLRGSGSCCRKSRLSQ